MSTEELDRYKALYAQFLEEIIQLHNAHIQFINNLGRDSTFKVHKHSRNIIKIQKEFFKSCSRAHAEQKKNTKERLAKQREYRAYRRANPLKRGRKKKIKNDLDISKSTSGSTT